MRLRYEGRSINKSDKQNGIFWLIVKISKTRNIRFVGNFFLHSHRNFYNNDTKNEVGCGCDNTSNPRLSVHSLHNGAMLHTGRFNGPITISIRARFEYDSSAIRARYNIVRGVMCFRAIMNMSILSRCCRML